MSSLSWWVLSPDPAAAESGRALPSRPGRSPADKRFLVHSELKITLPDIAHLRALLSALALRHDTGMMFFRKKWRYGFESNKEVPVSIAYHPKPSHFQPCFCSIAYLIFCSLHCSKRHWVELNIQIICDVLTRSNSVETFSRIAQHYYKELKCPCIHPPSAPSVSKLVRVTS